MNKVSKKEYQENIRKDLAQTKHSISTQLDLEYKLWKHWRQKKQNIYLNIFLNFEFLIFPVYSFCKTIPIVFWVILENDNSLLIKKVKYKLFNYKINSPNLKI